jgi:hypothetical protein
MTLSCSAQRDTVFCQTATATPAYLNGLGVPLEQLLPLLERRLLHRQLLLQLLQLLAPPLLLGCGRCTLRLPALPVRLQLRLGG